MYLYRLRAAIRAYDQSFDSDAAIGRNIGAQSPIWRIRAWSAKLCFFGSLRCLRIERRRGISNWYWLDVYHCDFSRWSERAVRGKCGGGACFHPYCRGYVSASRGRKHGFAGFPVYGGWRRRSDRWDCPFFRQCENRFRIGRKDSGSKGGNDYFESALWVVGDDLQGAGCEETRQAAICEYFRADWRRRENRAIRARLQRDKNVCDAFKQCVDRAGAV